MLKLFATIFLTAGLCGISCAQETFPEVRLKEVTETLKYLASDELAGRDTPSPGLDQAADYLARRFKEAGLKGVGENGEYFHHYTRPGSRVVLAKAMLKLHVEDKVINGKPLTDFRIYRSPTDGYELAELTEPARMKLEDAARKGLWSGRPIKKILFVETPEESALWKSCRNDPMKLRQRRRRSSMKASAPIILVRPGFLPKEKFRVTASIPKAQEGRIPLRNVIGILPGTTKPDEYVLVTAHYDHVGVGIPRGKDKKDTIYNGADDDATGTTAVVELAELFAGLDIQQKPQRSLIFVCFSGEEKGLLGSKAMAKSPPFPLDQVVANINIEMIGRPAKGKRRCAWITGASQSNFGEIAKIALKRAGVKMISFAMGEQLYRASDNYAFVEKGIVAHSISAGSLHKDYHQPSDEIEKIDLKHMTQIVNGLGEVVREFANRANWPKKSQGR